MRLRASAATVLGVLLVGCTTPVDPPPTATTGETVGSTGGGSLRWALPADPTSLDPARIVTGADEIVADALFDSLVRLGPAGDVLPGVASSWSVDDEARTFRFTIDEDARWHDGSTVVAADVVRGLDRIADGSAPQPSLHAGLLRPVVGFDEAARGEGLSGVVEIDERTVEIRTTNPAPELLVALTHPALAPSPPAATEDPRLFGEEPIGNGPFALAEPWVHNQFLRLVPAAEHPRGAALDELVFRVYEEDPTGELRWADLVGGQVQVSDVPAARLDEVEAAIGLGALRDGLTDVTSLLLVSTARPPVDLVDVRRGISLLVDRAGVAARTNGARVAADAIVPPSLLGAQGAPCELCRRDVATARRLIRSALASVDGSDATGVGGVGGIEDATTAPTAEDPGDGAATGPSSDAEPTPGATSEVPTEEPPEPLVILTADDAISATVAEQLRASLRQLDVVARIESVPAAEVPARLTAGSPAIPSLPWTSLAPTAESFLTELLGPGSVGREVTGWEPAALDELLARVRIEADPEERHRLVAEVERLALDSGSVVPVHFRLGDLAVAPSVDGLAVGVDGLVDLSQVTVSATL